MSPNGFSRGDSEIFTFNIESEKEVQEMSANGQFRRVTEGVGAEAGRLPESTVRQP